MLTFIFSLAIASCSGQVGKLIDPSHRRSIWRFNSSTEVNKFDDRLNCGSIKTLLNENNKCGLCGDPVSKKRHHEYGGKYASGVLSRHYPNGTNFIHTIVEIGSKHNGYFEFRLCVQNRYKKTTEECFNKNRLKIVGGSLHSGRTRYYTRKHEPREYQLTVQLPLGIVCSHCVLQWRFVSVDELGKDADGKTCYGCGIQQHIRNCADISIGTKQTALNVSQENVTIMQSSFPVHRKNQTATTFIDGQPVKSGDSLSVPFLRHFNKDKNRISQTEFYVNDKSKTSKIHRKDPKSVSSLFEKFHATQAIPKKDSSTLPDFLGKFSKQNDFPGKQINTRLQSEIVANAPPVLTNEQSNKNNRSSIGNSSITLKENKRKQHSRSITNTPIQSKSRVSYDTKDTQEYGKQTDASFYNVNTTEILTEQSHINQKHLDVYEINSLLQKMTKRVLPTTEESLNKYERINLNLLNLSEAVEPATKKVKITKQGMKNNQNELQGGSKSSKKLIKRNKSQQRDVGEILTLSKKKPEKGDNKKVKIKDKSPDNQSNDLKTKTSKMADFKNETVKPKRKGKKTKGKMSQKDNKKNINSKTKTKGDTRDKSTKAKDKKKKSQKSKGKNKKRRKKKKKSKKSKSLKTNSTPTITSKSNIANAGINSGTTKSSSKTTNAKVNSEKMQSISNVTKSGIKSETIKSNSNINDAVNGKLSKEKPDKIKTTGKNKNIASESEITAEKLKSGFSAKEPDSKSYSKPTTFVENSLKKMHQIENGTSESHPTQMAIASDGINIVTPSSVEDRMNQQSERGNYKEQHPDINPHFKPNTRIRTSDNIADIQKIIQTKPSVSPSVNTVRHDSSVSPNVDTVRHDSSVSPSVDTVRHDPSLSPSMDTVSHEHSVSQSEDTVRHDPSVSPSVNTVRHHPSVFPIEETVHHYPSVSPSVNTVHNESSVYPSVNTVYHEPSLSPHINTVHYKASVSKSVINGSSEYPLLDTSHPNKPKGHKNNLRKHISNIAKPTIGLTHKSQSRKQTQNPEYEIILLATTPSSLTVKNVPNPSHFWSQLTAVTTSDKQADISDYVPNKENKDMHDNKLIKVVNNNNKNEVRNGIERTNFYHYKTHIKTLKDISSRNTNATTSKTHANDKDKNRVSNIAFSTDKGRNETNSKADISLDAITNNEQLILPTINSNTNHIKDKKFNTKVGQHKTRVTILEDKFKNTRIRNHENMPMNDRKKKRDEQFITYSIDLGSHKIKFRTLEDIPPNVQSSENKKMLGTADNSYQRIDKNRMDSPDHGHHMKVKPRKNPIINVIHRNEKALIKHNNAKDKRNVTHIPSSTNLGQLKFRDKTKKDLPSNVRVTKTNDIKLKGSTNGISKSVVTNRTNSVDLGQEITNVKKRNDLSSNTNKPNHIIRKESTITQSGLVGNKHPTKDQLKQSNFMKFRNEERILNSDFSVDVPKRILHSGVGVDMSNRTITPRVRIDMPPGVPILPLLKREAFKWLLSYVMHNVQLLEEYPSSNQEAPNKILSDRYLLGSNANEVLESPTIRQNININPRKLFGNNAEQETTKGSVMNLEESNSKGKSRNDISLANMRPVITEKREPVLRTFQNQANNKINMTSGEEDAEVYFLDVGSPTAKKIFMPTTQYDSKKTFDTPTPETEVEHQGLVNFLSSASPKMFGTSDNLDETLFADKQDENGLKSTDTTKNEIFSTDMTDAVKKVMSDLQQVEDLGIDVENKEHLATDNNKGLNDKIDYVSPLSEKQQHARIDTEDDKKGLIIEKKTIFKSKPSLPSRGRHITGGNIFQIFQNRLNSTRIPKSQKISMQTNSLSHGRKLVKSTRQYHGYTVTRVELNGMPALYIHRRVFRAPRRFPRRNNTFRRVTRTRNFRSGASRRLVYFGRDGKPKLFMTKRRFFKRQ